MDDKIDDMNAARDRLGVRLRQIRDAHELQQVDVEVISRRIADREGCPDFVVSNSRLSAIEHDRALPGPGKLLTLGEIYGLSREQLMKLWATTNARGQ
jgi:transcriptional regulator with XRE-family HTH domain